MSTSKQYANVYVKKYSRVRCPLRECRSIRSGASGLPYYCAPLARISAVMELLAVWRHNKPKTKNHFGAKTQSEGTIQLVPKPRKMLIIIPRRRRGTWEGVPVAKWCRLSTRSGWASFCSETAYRPAYTIVWRYFHTSIFTSRRDTNNRVSWSQNSQFFEILYFQEFCLSRPKHFFQESTTNHQKKIEGLRPAPPPYRLHPSHPPR